MFTTTPFSAWELNDDLLAGLESIGWEFATQVQKETIPLALSGKDVIGQARTGSGKTAAFFGCGDQVGYSDNFLDAIGMLAKPFMEKGGNLIGRWSTEGYEFDGSVALDGDEFLGLGLDNDNQEEETEERLIIWAELIRDEFK